MAAAMSASYLRCSSSGYRYVGPLAVGFVGFAGGAPAGGEDVPAAPLTPGMDRMAGSSMSPSEPNEDRRTCPCVGGCATGTVVPGGGYTGCPCGVVSTVPRSGDPTVGCIRERLERSVAVGPTGEGVAVVAVVRIRAGTRAERPVEPIADPGRHARTRAARSADKESGTRPEKVLSETD